jgi:hypothetical protein
LDATLWIQRCMKFVLIAYFWINNVYYAFRRMKISRTSCPSASNSINTVNTEFLYVISICGLFKVMSVAQTTQSRILWRLVSNEL